MVKVKARHVPEGKIYNSCYRLKAVSKPPTVNGVQRKTISQLNWAADCAIDDIDIINMRVQERCIYVPSSWKPSRPPLAVIVEIKVEKGCTGFDSVIAHEKKEREAIAEKVRKERGGSRKKASAAEASSTKALVDEELAERPTTYVTKVTAAMIEERAGRTAIGMGDKVSAADTVKNTTAEIPSIPLEPLKTRGKGKRKTAVNNGEDGNKVTAGTDKVENVTSVIPSKTAEISTVIPPTAQTIKAVINRRTKKTTDKAEKITTAPIPTTTTTPISVSTPVSILISTTVPSVTKVTAAMVRERAERDSLNGPTHRISMRMTSSPSGSRTSLGTEVENEVENEAWIEREIERRQREEGETEGENERELEGSNRQSNAVQPSAKWTTIVVQSSSITDTHTSGTSSSSSTLNSNLSSGSALNSNLNSSIVLAMRRKTILSNVITSSNDATATVTIPDLTVIDGTEIRQATVDPVDTVDLTENCLEVSNGRRSNRLKIVAEKKNEISENERIQLIEEEEMREEAEEERVEEMERIEFESRGKDRRERFARRESEKGDSERSKRIEVERKEKSEILKLKKAMIARRKKDQIERDEKERKRRRMRRDREDDELLREGYEMEKEEVSRFVFTSY